MRGLGKLAAMLNPLDQSAVNQIVKSAGAGRFGQAMALGRAGLGQVKSGAYFKGQHLVHGGKRGFHSKALGDFGRTMLPPARKQYARGTGNLRQAAAMGVGAWAGLNLLAPGSTITKGANLAAGTGAMIGLGQGPIKSRWGGKGQAAWYGAGGAAAAGSMFGAF